MTITEANQSVDISDDHHGQMENPTGGSISCNDHHLLPNKCTNAAASGKHQVVFIKGDICVYDDVDRAMKQFGVDGVFHIAAYGMSGNTNLAAHNKLTEAINITGTRHVTETCRANGVKALGTHGITSPINRKCKS